MNIAIIAAHFMPEIGYKEVIMARVLARQGHAITVVTTADSPSKSRSLLDGEYQLGKTLLSENLLVWRLPHRWRFGSIVIAERNAISEAISEILPDIVIVIGIGKMFPNPVLLSADYRKYGLISIFGDHNDYFPNIGFKQSLVNFRVWIIKKIVKNRAVRRAIAASDLIVGYTPDTLRILKGISGSGLVRRLIARYFEIPLGYDSKEYYYSDEVRKKMRDELGFLNSDILIVTVTRVTPSKQIELAIEAVAALANKYSIKYYIIGSLEDAYASKLQSMIDQYGLRNVVEILPFMSAVRKHSFYCASDVGVWSTAAITIQEAMGTGLKLVLPNKTSVAHLIDEGINGWITNSVKDGLDNAIVALLKMDADEKSTERGKIEAINNKVLSYDSIMASILTEYTRKRNHES